MDYSIASAEEPNTSSNKARASKHQVGTLKGDDRKRRDIIQPIKEEHYNSYTPENNKARPRYVLLR